MLEGSRVRHRLLPNHRRRINGGLTRMADSLTDRVVLVIGASSGIGRQTAILFAREGARVMASARREDRLRELAMEMAAAGCAIQIHPADVTKAGDMDELA